MDESALTCTRDLCYDGFIVLFNVDAHILPTLLPGVTSS